jgi:hypothetical protein
MCATEASAAAAAAGNRKRRQDDPGEPPRQSKRTKRGPYEDLVDSKLLEVLAHWRNQTPTTPDAPTPADDGLAEQIVPSDDRNCVAILRRASARTLVAMNTWNGQLVSARIPVGNYEQVGDTTPQLHAEMKILDYCGANHIPIASRIGISKRCCLRCAVVMHITGNGGHHRGNGGGLWNAGWKLPTFIRRNSDYLEDFLSVEIFEWWMTLTNQQGDDFLRRLERMEE